MGRRGGVTVAKYTNKGQQQMTLTTTSVSLAGLQLQGAKDNQGNYYIYVSCIEKILGWRPNSAREKIASKSLKALVGKDLTLGKKKADHGGFVTLLSTKDTSLLIAWAANNGNKVAQVLLVALTMEALERRIDHALGVVVQEEDRQERTRQYFRELAKVNYIPRYTSWNERHAAYGKFANQLKRALSLPLESINTYTMEQIKVWYDGILTYHAFRTEGYTHASSLGRARSLLSDV